jgi:hypothetical protein
LAPDEFLNALAYHDQHEDMVRWLGKSFDPEYACTSTGSLSILIGSRENGPHAPAQKLKATTGTARSRGLRWMVTTHLIVLLQKNASPVHQVQPTGDVTVSDGICVPMAVCNDPQRGTVT